MAKGMLIDIALDRVGIVASDVLFATFGSEAVRMAGDSDRSVRRQAPTSNVEHANNVERARDIIDAEFATQLTVKSLSKRLHVHRNQLSAEFRRAYHRSIHFYLVQRRVLRAAQLIRDGKMAIDDVASSVGYRSKTNFCQQFKSLMGVSPGRFRTSDALADEVQNGPPTCNVGIAEKWIASIASGLPVGSTGPTEAGVCECCEFSGERRFT